MTLLMTVHVITIRYSINGCILFMRKIKVDRVSATAYTVAVLHLLHLMLNFGLYYKGESDNTKRPNLPAKMAYLYSIKNRVQAYVSSIIHNSASDSCLFSILTSTVVAIKMNKKFPPYGKAHFIVLYIHKYH